jgi:dTMP kinase
MHIVIEGQDATGKDTQAELLAEYFRKQGKNVVHYSESGTGSKVEFISEIARLNYGSDQGIDHRTRVLLYLVNRYEQWRTLAEPALKKGDIVITSRNWFSTLIYEGYGAGVSKSLIIKLHKLIMPEPYFHPDKIVFFTLSDEDRNKRIGTQTAEAKTSWTRKDEVWKSQGDPFQHKLNHGYLDVAKKFNIPTLDASGTIEEVFEDLKKLFKL